MNSGWYQGQFDASRRAQSSFEETRDRIARSLERIRISLELSSRDVPGLLQEYRAYRLGADGHIESRFEFLCPSEAVAKQRVLELMDGHAIELWRGSRRIANFSPGATQGPHVGGSPS
jgi:hypothetical protein